MRHPLVCAALIGLAGCSHAPPPPVAKVAPAKPGALDATETANAMLAREATGLVPTAIHSGDGELQLTVAAKGTPKLEPLPGKQHFMLTVPIGTQQAIYCRLGPTQDLAAGTLSARADVNKLPHRQITDVNGGALNGAAFLSTRTIYSFERDGVKQWGEVKTAAAERGFEFSAICVHDEVGYAATLRDVLGSLVQSGTFVGAATSPAYRELSSITLAGKIVGISQTQLVRADDGRLWSYVDTAMLIPASPLDFQGHDNFESEVSDGAGNVVSATHIASQGEGELQYKLKLTRTPKGYHVDGEFGGKRVDAEIASAEALAAADRAARLTRELMAGKRRDVVLPHYAPSADPLGFAQATVTPSGDKELPYRREDSDKTVSLVDVDDNGNGRRGRTQVGPLTLEIARTAEYGHFPQ